MKPIPEAQTKIILDSVADGVFTVDAEWRITSFNKAAETITGISKEQAMGRRHHGPSERSHGSRNYVDGEARPRDGAIGHPEL